MPHFEYVIAGGGLQSGLLCLALRARRPDVRLCVVERGGRLGGNHTWCFHDADIAPGNRLWLEPLVQHRWSGYDVLFPSRRHTVREPYFGVSSERFHEVVSAAVVAHDDSELRLGAEVARVGSEGVSLATGEEISADAVIDARGPEPAPDRAPAGYQKFLGLELRLSSPHALDRPVLMDATVDQSEGYRFLYVLPLSARTLLVEDTYFHESPRIDRGEVRERIHRYAHARGWRIASEIREEAGVLPMPWSGGVAIPRSGPLRTGYRGGWFHPGTGYSFPVAVRLADFVAGRAPAELFGPELARFTREHEGQARFARFLNRLLFRWYPPRARRSIFERFYALPEDTIRSFYALRLGPRDRLRLLLGRPPRGLSLRYRLGRSR